MATLVKSATVMELACATQGCACKTVGVDGLVQYLAVDEDTQAPIQTFGIPATKYEDLGQPATITLHLEPGDHLND